MSKKIRIGIADDHNLFRKGLIALLEDYDDLEVVFDVADGKDLIPELEGRNDIDVLVIDYEMPLMNGLHTTRMVREIGHPARIIILTMHNSEELILQFVEAGANGFLQKDIDSENVVDAIHSVIDNNFYFNENISSNLLFKVFSDKKIAATFNTTELTDIEIEVMRYICEEKTNKEIADLQNLSSRTIEGTRNRILRKINAKNTAGIVIYCVKNGIITI